MAHGLNSMIKREIECSSSGVNKNQISQSTLSPNNSSVNNNNNNSVNSSSQSSGNNNCGNAKMGSRRIFTPQFKLQVLESYRNDSDCKGNQRATARKYGIHRRQIQKWLQCETNLRSSVANQNQNSVKHQFHNISHQMPMVVSAAAAATHTNSSHNHHQQYNKASVLSLDTARHSVALTPMTLPALPSAAAAATQPILTAAATTTTILPTVAIVATRPTTTTTKCVNGVSNTATMNKTLTNTMPNVQAPYTHTPAISSAPLAAAVSHYHHHHNHPHQHHRHHHHPHHQQQQQHHQHHSLNQHESRLLMPSASLPVPGSPVSAATNRTDELRDYQPITVTGNCYMNEDYRTQQIYESLQYYNSSTSGGGISSTGTAAAPIDLSLRPRQKDIIIKNNDNKSCHNNNNNIKTAIVKSWQQEMSCNNINNGDLYKKQIKIEPNDIIKIDNHDLDNSAVDLTYRKRKNNNGGGVNDDHNDDDDAATPEKVQKTKDNNNRKDDDQQAKPVKLFKPYLLDDKDDVNDNKMKKIKCEQQDPIIWSHHPTCVNPCSYECQGSNRGSNFQSSDGGYAFPAGSPTFHIYERAESITSAATPPTAAGTTTSAAAATTPPTGSTFWCPKGSPVSGYDSASTYSDSSDYYINNNNNNNNTTSSRHQHHFETYSLDLKMQAIDSYYHDMTCRGDQLAVAGKFNVHRSEVQRWLDQEANIRQGIALFV